jgi:hypothetical protein
MNKLIVAAWLALLFIWTPVWAVKVSTLYDVQVAVASQASDARADAIRDGLQQVLTRLTGDQSIATNKQIKASLDRADYFVLEYSYSSPDVSSATYTLNIKYNQQDVQRLLHKMGMKQWGSTRPLVLVWLATINTQHEVDILGVETANAMLEKFKNQGQRYGLPLIFPVMDVTDMDKVSSDNITSVSLPELKEASKRYQPDALLIGTIERNNDGYQARWNLVMKDKSWDWTTSGSSQDQVIAEALDHVSKSLAPQGHLANNNNG